MKDREKMIKQVQADLTRTKEQVIKDAVKSTRLPNEKAARRALEKLIEEGIIELDPSGEVSFKR